MRGNNSVQAGERGDDAAIRRAIFQAAQDAIFVLRNDSIVDCNEKALEMFACTRQDIIGQSLAAFSPENQSNGQHSAKKARRCFQMAMRGKRQSFDWHYKRSDGRLFKATVSLSGCKNKQGKHVVAVIRDISAYGNMQEALFENQEKYRTLLDSANETIIVAQDGLLKYTSAAGEQLTDYSQDELQGMPFLGFIHADDQGKVIANYKKRLLGEPVPRFYHFRIVTKSGQIKWVRISATVIEWENQPATLNFLTDVTEQRAAEEALRENERLMRTIAENYPRSYVLIIDKKLNVIFVAGHGFSKEKATPETYLNKNVENIFSVDGPDAVDKIKKACKATFDGAELSFFQITRHYELYIRTVPLTNQNGEIDRILTVVENVTEQHQAKQQLQEIEEKFRLVFDNASDAIYLLELSDNGAIIREANAAALLSRGYQREEIIGKEAEMFIAKDRRGVMPQTMERLMAGEPVRYEAMDQRKDGATFPVEISARMISIGNTPYILSIERDISERKNAENMLQKQHALLQATIESTTDGILVIDKDGRVVQTNGRFAEMWQIPTDLINTGDDSKLLQFVLDQLTEPKVFLDKVMELYTSEADSLDVIYFKDGRVFERYSCPLWQSSEVQGRVWSFRDISKRKRAEAQLSEYQAHLEALIKERTQELEKKNLKMQQAHKALRYLVEDATEARKQVEKSNELLTEANKQLESFAYSVSHDLRAPLRAVSGFAHKLSRLYDKQLDAEGKRIINVINDNTLKMGQLIDDLLAFSRIGRSVLTKSDIDMTAMATAIADELTAMNPDLAIDFHIATVPKATGDQRLLRQAMYNLFENAVKYSSRREKIRIELSFEEEQGERAYCIKDNGVGFDMKYAEHLFEVFHRLHNDSEFKGTGVGLAITKLIIQRHDGRIWAKAKEGVGAAFYFVLPLVGE